MEALRTKRVRLRDELRQAYDAWIDASEQQASHRGFDKPVDISGSPEAAKPQWFEYLAAKQRLVLAFAEQPLAA
jgi:hypothetical protein